jgi:serine/threonine-protein kinase HipA
LVSSYFENLLPESKAIRERFRSRYHVASSAPFDLLAEIGRDCVGAIQLLPPDLGPEGFDEIESEPLTEGQVASILKNTVRTGSDGDEDDLRISIAGAQEKTALLWRRGRWCKPRRATPTTHILKLPLGVVPMGVDLSTSVENEWLCLKILEEFGLPVAHAEIGRFEDTKALVVTRFDRRDSAEGRWIMRLPQEDFAQATGTPPDAKYESDGGPGIKQIMSLLLGAGEPDVDRQKFFRTQVVFWLLCAIDGHSKNFSLFIERDGRFRLTPGYDVLSAFPVLGNAARKIAPEKAKMAMAVWGENRHYRWSEIRRTHFESTARSVGLGSEGSAIIDEVITRAPEVIRKMEASIPAGFPQAVSAPILEGVSNALVRLKAR